MLKISMHLIQDFQRLFEHFVNNRRCRVNQSVVKWVHLKQKNSKIT